jgi:hypothetical protein
MFLPFNIVDMVKKTMKSYYCIQKYMFSYKINITPKKSFKYDNKNLMFININNYGINYFFDSQGDKVDIPKLWSQVSAAKPNVLPKLYFYIVTMRL